MTNQMPQTHNNDPQGQAHIPRLLVAMEMSLKKWGVALAVEGQPRKRVKSKHLAPPPTGSSPAVVK